MMNIIKWIKVKGWFILDLPYFIKQHKFRKGLELGAKAGRSMFYSLRANKNLSLTGIDLWEIMEGSAYKDNDKNEFKCKKRLKSFANRVKLIKGDAKNIAKSIPDQEYEFIYYDLQCVGMSNFHRGMLEQWIPKIKKGGLLIGRDFRAFRDDIYKLGYKESDIKRCMIGKRISERLEYIEIK